MPRNPGLMDLDPAGIHGAHVCLVLFVARGYSNDYSCKMRDGQTKCLTHNRWFVDGFGCPECERDSVLDRQTEALERQSDYLEELASETRSPEEIHHSHEHVFKHEGIALGVRVDVKPPDPDAAVNQALETMLVGIAAQQVKGVMGTFEQLLDAVEGCPRNIAAAALLRGLKAGLLKEDTSDDGRIVLKVNVESAELLKLVPSPRSEKEFLKDLSTRLASAHGMTVPSFPKG